MFDGRALNVAAHAPRDQDRQLTFALLIGWCSEGISFLYDEEFACFNKSMRLFSVVFLISLGFLTQVAAADGKVAISPLRKSGEGCGCAFKSRTAKSVYAWSELGEFGTSESIAINIDGKDLILQKKASDFPDSKRDPSKSEPKKGERLKEVFEGSGVRATLDYLYKGRCADLPEYAGSESCEYNSYDVDLKINRGHDKASVNLYGTCGC